MKLPKKKKINAFLRKWHNEKRKQTIEYIKEHTEYILNLIHSNENKTATFNFNVIDVCKIGIKYIAMQYGFETKISKVEFPDFNDGYYYNLTVSKK